MTKYRNPPAAPFGRPTIERLELPPYITPLLAPINSYQTSRTSRLILQLCNTTN
jgi:hypothetical protein